VPRAVNLEFEKAWDEIVLLTVLMKFSFIPSGR